MSSHCGRYPGCGCNSYCGTKCQLPEGDPRLKEKEPEFGEETEKFKQMEFEKYLLDQNGKHIKRRKPTNYTPPKNKRKKHNPK